MGLREKVTLVFATIILIQISSRHCMPKSINSTPLRTNRRLKRISHRPAITTNTFNNPKAMEPTNDKIEIGNTKYSKNLLNKLIKETKSKYSSKAKSEPAKKFVKPFVSTPQPYCFKDTGTFPEVEYPMFVTDIWTPNYWKKLPDVQQDLQTTNYKHENKKNTEDTTYIKPSDKAIEKAIKALIKYKEQTKQQELKNTIKTSEKDICPLEPPNQCWPEDQPQIKNLTTSTVPSATNQDIANFDDPHPMYGTYLYPSQDEPFTSFSTTSAPYDTNDPSQMQSPLPLTPAYADQTIPTATTAMPPYLSSGFDSKSTGTTSVTGVSDSSVTSNSGTTGSESSQVTGVSESIDSVPAPITYVLPLTGSGASPVPSNLDSPGGATSPSETPGSTNIFETNNTGLVGGIAAADSIPPTSQVCDPCEDTPTHSDTKTSLTNSSSSSSSSVTSLTSNSVSDANSVSSISQNETFSEIGSADYEFATMPPYIVSYDTSEKNIDPDDMASRFSPGDDYFMMT